MKCDYRDAAVAALHHEGEASMIRARQKPRAMTMTHVCDSFTVITGPSRPGERSEPRRGRDPIIHDDLRHIRTVLMGCLVKPGNDK